MHNGKTPVQAGFPFQAADASSGLAGVSTTNTTRNQAHAIAGNPSACPVMHKGATTGQPIPAVFLPGAPAFPPSRTAVNSSTQVAAAVAKDETSGLNIVGDIFPDSKPTLGQRFLLSPIPCQSSIPKSARAKPPTIPADVPKENLIAAGLPVPEEQPLACTSDAAAPATTPETKTQTEDETWTFPSHQRFYNAMRKKGWNPREEDIPYIVSIHNTINERTWREVMRYEEFHADECKTPKLLRFQGLPTEYSMKARLKSYLLGYVLPFDRHDWTVDRCGKEVRYIIDFYQGSASADPTLPAAVHIDVRPSPSTVEGVVDRVRMYFKDLFRMQ